ncbi:MAG: hypothetical protein WC685_05880 [Methylobacter sp.]
MYRSEYGFADIVIVSNDFKTIGGSNLSTLNDMSLSITAWISKIVIGLSFSLARTVLVIWLALILLGL